jgi:hypothetical protein
MNLKIKTQKSLKNLDYFGTVLISFYDDLKSILGNPDGESPNYIWYRETSAGNPFVIMDKGGNGKNIDKPLEFFIIAGTEEITAKAMNEILEEGRRLGIE